MSADAIVAVLRAHQWDQHAKGCVCGWTQRKTAPRGMEQRNHPHHVAHMLETAALPAAPAVTRPDDDSPVTVHEVDGADDVVAAEHYQRAFDAVALIMSGGGEVAATPSREFYAYVVDEVCMAVEYDRLRFTITEQTAEIERLRAEVKLHESSGVLSAVLEGAEQLRQQRRAALALHQHERVDVEDVNGISAADVCTECGGAWPCDTRAALGAADEPTTGGSDG